jgi:hypothetical protein
MDARNRGAQSVRAENRNMRGRKGIRKQGSNRRQVHARNKSKTNVRRHGPREVGRKTEAFDKRWQTRIEAMSAGLAFKPVAPLTAETNRVRRITHVMT